MEYLDLKNYITSICGDNLMKKGEFIEQFKNALKITNNYNFILEELNRKVFPFHARNKYVSYRRYYYWLKHHNIPKFIILNKELKEIVGNIMKRQT